MLVKKAYGVKFSGWKIVFLVEFGIPRNWRFVNLRFITYPIYLKSTLLFILVDRIGILLKTGGCIEDNIS